jgi:hypothetical protein
MKESETVAGAPLPESDDRKRANPRLYLAQLERELEKDEKQLQHLQEDMKALKREIRNWLHILG